MRTFLRSSFVLISLLTAFAVFAQEKKTPPAKLVFNAKNGDVTFDHTAHLMRAKGDCKTCHDSLFKEDAKAPLNFKPNIHKTAEKDMTSCGSCHRAGGASFESKGNCNKCHMKRTDLRESAQLTCARRRRLTRQASARAELFARFSSDDENLSSRFWRGSCNALDRMCLAIPGKVLSIEDGDPAFRSGCVDFCGEHRVINFAYTPEVTPGDYVIAHVGFAVTRISPEEAAQKLADLIQAGALINDPVGDPSAGSVGESNARDGNRQFNS